MVKISVAYTKKGMQSAETYLIILVQEIRKGSSTFAPKHTKWVSLGEIAQASVHIRGLSFPYLRDVLLRFYCYQERKPVNGEISLV